MRIVLVTPLYPPEIALPAPYVKELAKRLAELHTVTIVAYTHLPEQVPDVSILPIDKRKPLPLRLLSCLWVLHKVVKDADILYAENGASIELPMGLVALATKKPLIMHVGDHAAHLKAKQSSVLRSIEQFAFARAKQVVTDIPLSRPEIMPLEAFPTEAFAAYEQSWDAHIRALEAIFTHASK